MFRNCLFAFALLACGGEDFESKEPICEPGKTAACVCAGAADGSQVCADDGLKWGECECDSACDTNADCTNDSRCSPSGACQTVSVLAEGSPCDPNDSSGACDVDLACIDGRCSGQGETCPGNLTPCRPGYVCDDDLNCVKGN